MVTVRMSGSHLAAKDGTACLQGSHPVSSSLPEESHAGPNPFPGQDMRQYLNASPQFGLGEVRDYNKSCNPEGHEL